jgi:glycine betaine/choline ABC-type transport system substrate-binding protein
MKIDRRTFLKGGAAASSIGLTTMAGCTGGIPGSSGGGAGSVKVGSKRFTEQELLSHMSIISLQENTDVEVKDETGLGGTSQVWRAIKNGEIDHYWTYTVTQWNQVHGKDEVIPDPEEIYTEVKTLIENQYDLTLLNPTKARADWTLIVRPDWAKEHGIETISDFASYIKDGNTDITFVTYAEFAERADGIPAMLETYDIPQETWDKVNVKKVGYGGLNYQILNNGQAVATSGWQSQPQIYQYDLRVLKDDKGFTSASVVAPLVRNDVLGNNGGVEETLNKIGPSVSTTDLRAMVLRASNSDNSASKVARNHLKEKDII